MSQSQFWREFGSDLMFLMSGIGSVFFWAGTAIFPSYFTPPLFWPIASVCTLVAALRVGYIGYKANQVIIVAPETVSSQPMVSSQPVTIVEVAQPEQSNQEPPLTYSSADDVNPADVRRETKMVCPRCRGAGLDWGRLERPCPKCDAYGFVSGMYLRSPKCLVCQASGWAYGRMERECQVCNGFGRRSA
jgi:hypothetical protein